MSKLNSLIYTLRHTWRKSEKKKSKSPVFTILNDEAKINREILGSSCIESKSHLITSSLPQATTTVTIKDSIPYRDTQTDTQKLDNLASQYPIIWTKRTTATKLMGHFIRCTLSG